MGFASFIERLARAYMEQERQRQGIPAREQAAREAELADLVKRAELARTLQELQLAPAAQESKIGLEGAQAGELRSRVVQPIETSPGATLVPQTFMAGRQEPYTAPPLPERFGVGGVGSFASNPFLVTDTQGRSRLAVRVKGGGYQFVDQIGGEPVGPGPTADQRNVEYQAAAVGPAFELVKASLDDFERSIAGGLPGGPSAMIPGTDAYFAKSRFQDQAKALLGAITARQAGEGSRLSDEDRVAYSQASTLVNSAILLPGGVEEARERVLQAEKLLKTVQQRRVLTNAPAAPVSAASPGTRRIRFDTQGNVVQ